MDVAEGAESATILIPEDLKGKNMLIEINSEDLQEFVTFYSSHLEVRFQPSVGELKVVERSTKKALPKSYVKVYWKNQRGVVSFFRDGFTDITGKFNYTSASGQSVSSVNKFAIFVSHEKYGQLIEIVEPPKQ